MSPFRGGPRPDNAAREAARIDAADALAFVFPVYWWSFPALLKSRIDRVFGYDERLVRLKE